MRHSDEYENEEPRVVIVRRGGSASAFLIGLAVGAGVALLLAPQTGEETRRAIRRRAKELGDAAREAAGDLGEKARGGYESARRSVEDRLEAARGALEIKKRQASEAIKAGRAAAKQAREELEARIAESKSNQPPRLGATRPRRPALAGDEVDPDDNSDAQPH
ncbi:MAG TPA: YtxH domain-containing protein [Gemmatimonadaceae bacterium]|nr:YtxH domain-containing protein [Gemmatimonadaceae bacterium]